MAEDLKIQIEEEKIEMEILESDYEDDDEVFFQDIHLLIEQGVSSDDIAMLKKIGINTVKGVQMTTRKKLMQIKGFTDFKVSQIKEAANKISQNSGFVTALEISKQRNEVFKISTGSQKLDELLGGGIESLSITEVFGESRTGKTQLAHTLSVTAQISSANGYVGGKVIFIDTDNTFRPSRIRAISDRFSLNQTTVLENILYARAYNLEHQFELLNSVSEKCHLEAGTYKLLIIDSIINLFLEEYSGGKHEIIKRQKKLAELLAKLKSMCEEYNIGILLTNQPRREYYTKNKFDMKPMGGEHNGPCSRNTYIVKKKISKKNCCYSRQRGITRKKV